MISLGETAIVLILLLLLILLLDFGVLSQVRMLEEKAIEVEALFEQDRVEDAYIKTGVGTPGRYK